MVSGKLQNKDMEKKKSDGLHIRYLRWVLGLRMHTPVFVVREELKDVR